MIPPLRRLATALFAIIATLPITARAQVVGGAAQPADALPTPRIDSLLDLETVIQRALAVSPDVASAREGVRTAQSAGRVAFGEYTPSVFATSQALRSNSTGAGAVNATPPDAYSAGLAASIDVITGGRREADRTRAAADLAAAHALNVSTRYATTLAAQSAFYQTLRSADLVD